ncbi:Long-chain-fatty-acid--CoA ligase 5 [Physocladia obscura]|uniref:Long-chain-fatty-acid--CoA ligase 5 n=1 Tax=Physocladia obscura TaxID=109957 RepID=A0AAD5T231_9FUNG|nr:Long-chain-fatty-acid--CoA ligase 5 [Physocladia obscura]
MTKSQVQTVEIAGSRPTNDSATGIFQNILPISERHKSKQHLTTLIEGFQESAKLFPTRPMLGHRPKSIDPATGNPVWDGYVWQSYRRISERRIAFGSGLLAIYKEVYGGAITDRFNVGLYSLNRPAWIIADLANMSYGLVTVPLYDTFGAVAVQYILNHSTPPVLICSFDKLENVISFIHKCPSVKILVSIEEVTPFIAQAFSILKKWAQDKGVVLYSFAQVEAIGSKARIQFPQIKSDDVCSISYTSGTTGDPKGAIITHKNIIAELLSASDSQDFNEFDVHISYLPLAHIYEKVAFATVMGCGGAVGFFRGDVSLLLEDIALLKPTLFFSVPRLLNRIHDKIITQANSRTALRSYIFSSAVAAKMGNYKKTGELQSAFWDTLVFKKVQAALGGRVRFICSTSAPIHSNVKDFLSIAFGCQVREVYGQTETTGAVTIVSQGDVDVGHVGTLISGSEMKLVSVPEMGYHAVNNQGEVWLRGPTVFKGYYKDEEKTREAVTEDGWLKTGDIGYIDRLGRLSIIDRKKNIFKLSQGEYIAPEKIENVYIQSPTIAQIFVHGESLRNELVAIVVLDPETCIPLSRKLGLLPADTPDSGLVVPGSAANPHIKVLAQNPLFKKIVLDEMSKVASEAGLAGFERVKSVYLEAEAFAVENDLLTPTMKLKRQILVKRYAKQIKTMYQEIDVVVGGPAKL